MLHSLAITTAFFPEKYSKIIAAYIQIVIKKVLLLPQIWPCFVLNLIILYPSIYIERENKYSERQQCPEFGIYTFYNVQLIFFYMEQILQCTSTFVSWLHWQVAHQLLPKSQRDISTTAIDILSQPYIRFLNYRKNELNARSQQSLSSFSFCVVTLPVIDTPLLIKLIHNYIVYLNISYRFIIQTKVCDYIN